MGYALPCHPAPSNFLAMAAVNDCTSIDRWERYLHALADALGEYLQGTGMALPLALSVPPPFGDLRAAYGLIDELFKEQEEIQRLIAEKNAARTAAEPFPEDGPLAARCNELRGFDRSLDALARYCLAGTAYFTALASTVALERDGAGREAARAIEAIYRTRPVRRYRDGGAELRVEGLWELVESVLRKPEAFYGKPRAYLGGALTRESWRKFRDRQMTDADRLGLTPKISSIDAKDARARRREISQQAIQAFDHSVADEGESALEVLIAAEDDRHRQQVIETFRAGLPDELGALLAAWAAAEPVSAAARRLGLRKSSESALRNRLGRLKRKLDAA